MKNEIIIFEKKYSDEELYDLERDLLEELNNEDFNPILRDIPRMDKYPEFRSGVFVVKVVWIDD